MKAIQRFFVAASAALVLSGCTTVFDEATSAITKTVAPRAELLPNGDYVLPAFSSADDGTRLSTASPRAVHESLSRIVAPMQEKERLYFVRVFASLGYYHGCKDRGRRHYIDNPFRSANLGICNMTTFYTDSQPIAQSILQNGRPDGRIRKVVQDKRLVSGTPIGDPYVVGYSDSDAWAKWIAWSGHRLDGKTRDELVQEFLQRSKGLHGKWAR